MHKELFRKIMVFGCGNTLLGDDGFGPAVVEKLLAEDDLPGDVTCEDVGTGVREHLFNFLLAPEHAPRHLLVLDAVDLPGRRPGEVFLITPQMVPPTRSHDFSLHQFPTVNLLQELADHTGTRVHIIAARVARTPERVAPGLSPPMQTAVITAARLVRTLLAGIRPEPCEVARP